MTQFLPSDLAKKLAVSFPPLAIEPVFEGYRLVCDRHGGSHLRFSPDDGIPGAIVKMLRICQGDYQSF